MTGPLPRRGDRVPDARGAVSGGVVTVPERTQELIAAAAAEPAAGESMLLALCRLCVVGLSLMGAALVLLSSAGWTGVVAATDGTAAAAEDLQFDLGEDPGVDAARAGPVLTPDLTVTSDRWPLFVPTAVGVGWPRCSRSRCGPAGSPSGCWTCTGTPPGS
jgi:hypothetical protein